jgi:hypothetical protein
MLTGDELLAKVQEMGRQQTIKEFFTLGEWDLIQSLVHNNREFCEDTEFDPLADYDNITNKIYKLFSVES